MENVEKRWWEDAFDEAGNWEGAKGPNEMPSDKVEAMVEWVVQEATRRGYEKAVDECLNAIQEMRDGTKPEERSDGLNIVHLDTDDVLKTIETIKSSKV